MKLETKCVQAGYAPKNGEPRVLPIVQSTTYRYDSAEEIGAIMDLAVPGFMYSRIDNPTLSCVEAKIAALEGGRGALLTSSGQAAVMLAILNICGAGDHVVSSAAIYGGSTNLFAVTLKRLGVDFTFVDPNDTDENIQKAFKPNTKALYGETLSNPTLNVLDIARFARIAHENGVPFIIDNTFATPVLCRPFEHGADIVVHSASKFMDGHATVLGGAIVEGGGFDWAAGGKYPGLTEPDESYHGVTYVKDFPAAPFITKARVQLMRDFGPTMSPLAAFILNYGLETLHLRMARHSENALAVAEYLEKHPKVTWVNYPGLASSPQRKLAKAYLPQGMGGVLSFGVKGGKEAAMTFMNKLKLAAIVVHVADARTSVLHPASTTHRQLNDEQLKASGVSPDLIRFSVGIESIDDILADLAQALA